MEYDNLAKIHSSGQVKAQLAWAIADTSFDAIVCTDRDGEILLWNMAARRMFGFAKRDALGKHITDLFGDEEGRSRLATICRLLKEDRGEIVGGVVEAVGLRSDGSTFYQEIGLSSEKIGERWILIAVIRDISQKKSSEDALRLRAEEAERSGKAMLFMLEDLNESRAAIEQAKKQWEKTFDAVTEPVFIHDACGRIVRANRAYAERAGISVEECIERRYWEIFPLTGKRLNSCRDAEFHGEAEEEMTTEGGVVFRTHSYSIEGSGGKDRLFIHFLQDITKRRKVENDLKASEENFRRVLKDTPDAIVIVDENGIISYVNDAATRVFVSSSVVRPGERFDLPFERGMMTEIDLQGEDGTVRELQMQAAETQWNGEDVTIVWVHDVTEEKRSKADLLASHARIRSSLEGTVKAITTAVEARDPYTAGHQRRVSALAAAIATEMELGEDKVEGIKMGALIHDIGKIHIPAEILSKPSRLTEIEYSLIMSHAEVGYDILKDIEFPWPVADIAYQHHERLDGSGYPQGLKGDAIRIEARITAVADVTEAMASHRPYRPGLGIDVALQEIEHGKGCLYDAAAVDACVRLFVEKGFSFE